MKPPSRPPARAAAASTARAAARPSRCSPLQQAGEEDVG